MARWWILWLAVVVAACGGGDRGVVATHLAMRPVPELTAEPDPGLALPARLAVIRIAGGQVTAVPARESVLWRAAEQRMNRLLPATLRFMPLVDPVRRLPDRAEGAPADAGASLDAALSEAAMLGFDAVLVYELAVSVENDPATAALRGLPLIGGIVPRTVATEGQGIGVASIIDPRSRTLLTQSETVMGKRYIASMDVSGGHGGRVVAMAEFALLNALMPKAEDSLLVLLSTSVAGL